MRIAFDSNILIYLAGVDRHPDDAAKITAVETITDAIINKAVLVVCTQAVGEMVAVMRRNRATAPRINNAVDELNSFFTLVGITMPTMRGALDLMHAHKLQFWDSVILNAAAESGCAMLLSEDMQAGFVWRGVAVVNPLAETLNPRLARLIEQA